MIHDGGSPSMLLFLMVMKFRLMDLRPSLLALSVFYLLPWALLDCICQYIGICISCGDCA